DDRYYNSGQSLYSNNGYGDSYKKGWNDEGFNDHFDRDRRFHEKEWYNHRRFEHRDADDMNFRNRGYYDNYDRDFYRHRRKFALEILIGRKDRF
ncbi:MAG: hypothetical protein ACHQF0_15195, partial [Chitinophagales bacterium]